MVQRATDQASKKRVTEGPGETGLTVESWIERYRQRLHRFALRVCRNSEDAQDVVQEAFLSAWRGFAAFRGDASPLTWLTQIARNACLKIRRRGKFDPTQEIPLDALAETGNGEASTSIGGASEDPEQRLLQAEIGAALQTEIDALPEPYREVLILRDVEARSAEDVAHALGLSIPAAKTRLHRARQMLREGLAAALYPQDS